MEVSLRYGRGSIRLDVPQENVAGVHRPRRRASAGGADPLAGVPSTEGGRRLAEDCSGRSLLFLLADATRDEPHRRILEAALACASGARRLVVGITTGSHRADTAGNRAIAAAAIESARRAGCPEPTVVIHDCRSARFVDHGVTSRGNRVLLSDILDDAEVVLVASDMKHHYFAGYSNPLKDFLPGIAAFESIERNHALALEPGATFGRHPLHPNPSRRTNPVAEDMLEAYRLAVSGRPCHALVTVSAEGRVAHARLGPLEETAAATMELVDEVASFSVPESARLVVSAGGAPQDDTLYLSQRAIELTRQAAAEGAEILLLAECRGGIADGGAAYENFYLELTRPLGEILERIRAGYRLYQHKAFKFAELLRRIEKLHLRSALPDAEVRAAHLEPVADPQSLIDGWIREDPSCRIRFFDEANRLCVIAP
jgi:nickel-dependent lactate racemase